MAQPPAYPPGDNSDPPSPDEVSPAPGASGATPPPIPRLSWRKRALADLRSHPILTVVAMVALVLATRTVWRNLSDYWPQTAVVAPDNKSDDPKKKPSINDAFTVGSFTIRPSGTDRIESNIKPGHWTTATLEARANFEDFRGEMAAEMILPQGQPVDLDGVPARLQVSRPAVLPKGQKKLLDLALFEPLLQPGRQVAQRLTSASGRDLWSTREVLSSMPSHQFFFVVLSRQPDDYRYLQSLDTVWAPHGSEADRGRQAHYRVLLPQVPLSAPLPSEATFWTSTAVLLWAGADPTILTPEQQQGLLDWLHWGGQLIVSGPESLDLLRDSFLGPYLSATGGEAWELEESTLAPLAAFAPVPKNDKGRLRVLHSWTGQHISPQGADAFVWAHAEGDHPLVVERPVGSGRVVVTAFRLSQRELVNWPGCDAFFNAVLLRRPPRRFHKTLEEKVAVDWLDTAAPSDQFLTTQWVRALQTGQRASRVRYLTREEKGQQPSQSEAEMNFRIQTQPNVADLENEFAVGGPNVAGWNDQSDVAKLARESLRAAAGVQMPSRLFVLSMLGGYLLVLVPLNWLVFRALGRVEWAWIAAPIVAVVFSVLVVNLAQLDIGFARSSTEIAVLELQGPYSRGHVTRYTALYTSLSSDYTVDFTEPGAVALPFGTGGEVSAQQSRQTVVLRRLPQSGTFDTPAVRLEQFSVSSNSTGMLHSEEMLPLAGGLELLPQVSPGVYRLRNGTGLQLSHAGVVGPGGGAYLDTIEPSEVREFTLSETDNIRQGAPNWSQSIARYTYDGLRLGPLYNLAILGSKEEEIRLVATTGDEIPGMTITPRANQAHHATVVVAHLGQAIGSAPRPQVDFNSRVDAAESIDENAAEDAAEAAAMIEAPTSP